MTRRATRRRAHTAAHSNPLLGSLSYIVDRLASQVSLDERLGAALEALRESLGARGAAVRYALDGLPFRELERGEMPADWDRSDAAAHLLSVPLDVDGGSRGALALAMPGESPVGDAAALAGLVARLMASAIANEQRVSAAAAERDAQRRFIARIVDSLPVGLYVVDREYRVQAWNRKRETGLQGVSRDAALGRNVFDVLHRQPAELLRRELDAVFANGVTQQYELETGTGADRRWYRVTKIPMRLDGGDVSHVIAIGEDMTERRRAQERAAQSEKLAAVGQLAAGVMHEVNNPLAVIGACGESIGVRLSQRDVTAEVRAALAEYLVIIDHEVQRCKGIVGRLLEFSRPTAESRSPFDLQHIVEETLFLLQHHTRVKQMRVETVLAEEPVTVVGAREQLIQVLIALVLNAADAMEGGGTIRIRVAREGEGAALLEVADCGRGIPPNERSRVFEPFYTTKPAGSGTGLGLSICYGIVAEHRGRIELDSEVGRGSTFRVVLPTGEES